MARQRITKTYWCDDCDLVFQVFWKSRKTPYCPDCGENLNVRTYKADERTPEGKKTKQTLWTDPELAVLAEVKAGTETTYRAALRLGRTRLSVTKKLGRI